MTPTRRRIGHHLSSTSTLDRCGCNGIQALEIYQFPVHTVDEHARLRRRICDVRLQSVETVHRASREAATNHIAWRSSSDEYVGITTRELVPPTPRTDDSDLPAAEKPVAGYISVDEQVVIQLILVEPRSPAQ